MTFLIGIVHLPINLDIIIISTAMTVPGTSLENTNVHTHTHTHKE